MVGTTAHDMANFYLFVWRRKIKDFDGRMGTWHMEQSLQNEISARPSATAHLAAKTWSPRLNRMTFGSVDVVFFLLPRISRNTDREDDENNKNNLTSSPNKLFFSEKIRFSLKLTWWSFFRFYYCLLQSRTCAIREAWILALERTNLKVKFLC